MGVFSIKMKILQFDKGSKRNQVISLDQLQYSTSVDLTFTSSKEDNVLI